LYLSSGLFCSVSALFPFSEFEFDLPLETVDKVHQLEEKLEDPSQVQSGKNLM